MRTRGTLIVSVSRYAGLGNRVRAVLSGQSLAEYADRRFFYCWPTERRIFGAAMTDLWQYGAHRVPWSLTKILAPRYPQHNANWKWMAEANADRVWQIRSGQPLPLPEGAVPWTERLRSLRPTDEIADRINDFFDANLRGRPYVGVMIRAHENSHEQTRAASPVSWFAGRMKEISDAVPDVGFYVSCDVPDGTQQILDQFSNAFALPGKGSYNSAISIKASVVDLYLLASSVHILGAHYSSFPELAAHLADGQIALETSVNNAEFHTSGSQWSLVEDPLYPHLRRAQVNPRFLTAPD
jgi:hypothetical protein